MVSGERSDPYFTHLTQVTGYLCYSQQAVQLGIRLGMANEASAVQWAVTDDERVCFANLRKMIIHLLCAVTGSGGTVATT
jgi:hypothetical protein